jgi:PKD repeat protein
VVLGTRGRWRATNFQEILIYPLKAGDTGGTASLLTSLTVRVEVPGVGKVRKTGEAGGCTLPAGVDLFLNPEDAGTDAASPVRPTFVPAVQLNPVVTYAAAAPKLRIEVSKDGLYRLDYAYLIGHDFPIDGTDPANLHLMCRGVEIPIVIEGPQTGSFGAGNDIVFYGQKMDVKDRPVWNGGDFTNTNVYWLFADSTPGLRMGTVNATPDGGFPVAQNFICMVHFETNNFFYCIYHIRPNGDLWYWGPVLTAASSGSYSLSLPHSAAGTNIQVEALVASLNGGTHTVEATLNGASPSSGPDPATWTGKALATFDWTFDGPPSPAGNALSLTIPASGDYQIPDYFNVTYTRTFDADSGSLLFTAPNQNAQYSSAGYASAPHILDLSKSDAGTGLTIPTLLIGADFSDGVATFQMAADPSVAARCVFLSSALLTPDDAQTVTPPDLSDPSLGADLLIITHPDFHPAGSDAVWQAYLARRSSEMSVKVVDIQDIYDNYSYGIFDPTAIRSFLSAAAANWDPVPKYVLLIGDASYDYKNYMQDSTFKDWVPTMMFEDTTDSTYMGRYPSDAWFADVNGDGYPDMAVGRLPVRSYDELAGVLTKIMDYEDQSLSGNWYKTGLFVADTYTSAWEQVFETYNDYLRATYTLPPWQDLHVYFHDPPYNGTDADACASDIRADWNQAVLVHYDGHSGVSFWGNHYAIFTSFPSRNCASGTCEDSDVDLLPTVTASSVPLPFVVNSSCYNSAFDEVGDPALMEDLINRPDRGSVGSCGFSTIAYPDEEETFNDAVFGQAFGFEKIRRLGDLVEAGRFASPSTTPRIVDGNILLGDPSMRLRMPAPQAPLSPRAQAGNSAVGLFWSPSPDLVSQYAVYRSDDGGGTWTSIATVPGSADTYEDAGLQNGTTYDYVVTSIDGEGFEGAPGPVVSATPTDLPCTLSCTAQAPHAAVTGNTVTFTASAVTQNCTGEPTYEWDFGDGSPLSGGVSTTHVYSAAGTYSWSMAATLPGATCSKGGTITIGAPPTVQIVKKRGNPFRIILKGSGFSQDASVSVGGAPWPNVKVKSPGKLVLKKGASLKAAFPHDTDVSIRIVNDDGGSVTVSYNRTTRIWRVLP